MKWGHEPLWKCDAMDTSVEHKKRYSASEVGYEQHKTLITWADTIQLTPNENVNQNVGEFFG